LRSKEHVVELLSPGHLVVIAILAGVLFFGWKQLPDMARSAGRSLRVFRTEVKGLGDDVRPASDASPE
jgi:sec-independent protein translocase protein TatA